MYKFKMYGYIMNCNEFGWIFSKLSGIFVQCDAINILEYINLHIIPKMHNTAHRSFIQIYLLINLYFNSTAHEFMSSRIICLGNKQYFQQIKAKYTKSI